MKSLVSDRPLFDAGFGVLAGMIIIVTHASTGLAFLITLAVGLVAAVIKFGPEQFTFSRKVPVLRSRFRDGGDHAT